MLIEVLKSKKIRDDYKILIFMNTKRGCDFLAAFLSDFLQSEKINFKCTSMHGDRSQAGIYTGYHKQDCIQDIKN